jgi:hypothetical protein
LAGTPLFLAVSVETSIKTLHEFVDHAWAHPGELNYGRVPASGRLKESPAEAGHWMSGSSQMKSAVLPDFAARVGGSLPDIWAHIVTGSHACSRVPAPPRRAFAFSHIAARSAPR